MKYGKEFQQLLDSSDFPEEWKSSAIEYRRLKKIIKDVVAELTSMGLSPDILNKLLVADNHSVVSDRRNSNSSGTPENELIEFEFESEEGSPSVFRSGRLPLHHEPQEVLVDPVLDDDRYLSTDNLHHPHPHKFRLRLLSEASQDAEPCSMADLPTAQNLSQVTSAYQNGPLNGRRGSEGSHKNRRVVKRAVSVGHGGIKAEYVVTGAPDHPVPQIRLHLSALTSHLPSPSPPPSFAESEIGTDTETEDEDPPIYSAPRTPRAFDRFCILSPNPSLNRINAAKSPIWAIASSRNFDGLADLSLGEAAMEEETLPTPIQQSFKTPEGIPHSEREFIIPLSSDFTFFSLLTTALTSLSSFHARQQILFQQSVEKLCEMISKSISPQASIEILPTPLTPSNEITPRMHPSKASRKDLYAWREIFTLWIEAQIFESNSERNRGERTVEEAELRLQKFANQVVKRGLGDRRTMKGKKVREAWEEFLRLNVLLLDLKKFQSANIKAARKILKKHDKRTALTASTGFQAFVRSTLTAQIDEDGNISTWVFYNTSLPHVLLASLTSTLLPILPSLDDYACLICTSIAFKPIRLACGHLFCVRCLVKMQKAGKGKCPLCRSDVILLADKTCLDLTVMNFMKEWFPKEVKAKQKENDEEIVKEQARETGMDTRCCIM
ncbi:conserved hypothetical protein [Cryptococcus deneoformans JEC21]|uniref:SPX domain-containing protein n=1 Tax=Cryptococcus deneoformans (strain JEC21 / ATCC MYA-565) TaxID=214684 RepID=Q5KEH5_CRYD1|nr:conserved hypothetical protein [Cryptococcus neoformans var. neoformans JEC21]AAW44448.1 conserved hypothetical protein [Cryptococcus neoformans var. neoformans JEC21]